MQAPTQGTRRNYTKDPSFIDGLRVVFFIADEPTGYDQVELLDWVWPSSGPKRKGERQVLPATVTAGHQRHRKSLR